MSSAAFFQQGYVQMIAAYVHSKTSIPVSVIMAQMGDETEYGTSQAWLQCHNPAGIENGGTCSGIYSYYPTYADAAVGYADFYLQNSNYANVLAVARSGASPDAVCYAIGQSQWALPGHYTYNGVEGGALVSIIQTYNLTQYDKPGALLSVPPSGSPGSATSTVSPPNCTQYGTYVGAGAAADVATGLYVFARTVNGVTIKTAVDQSCQLIGQWAHGTPKPVSVTTPATVFRNVVATVTQPQNMGIILIGLAIGAAGIYYLDKRNKGEPIFPIRLG